MLMVPSPVMEVPGHTPRSPQSVVAPVLVAVDAPRTAKLSAELKNGVAHTVGPYASATKRGIAQFNFMVRIIDSFLRAGFAQDGCWLRCGSTHIKSLGRIFVPTNNNTHEWCPALYLV